MLILIRWKKSIDLRCIYKVVIEMIITRVQSIGAIEPANGQRW